MCKGIRQHSARSCDGLHEGGERLGMYLKLRQKIGSGASLKPCVERILMQEWWHIATG